MAHQIDLRAEPRATIGKGLRALRKSGYVPANVYGPAMKSIPIQVEAKAFQSIANQASATTMINLSIESETLPRSVYLQKVQWQFVRREPFHLDFYQVNLKRHMRSAVRIVFHGESPASKLANAILLQPVAHVNVEALPDAMPESIAVDLSSLIEIDGSIHARDLILPVGVRLLDNPDDLIVRVQLSRGAVEEEKEAEAAPATATPAASTG